MIDLEKCKQFMAYHEGINPEHLTSEIISDAPDQVILIIDAKTKKAYKFYQTNRTLKLWK